MEKILMVLRGCDDNTTIEMEVSNEELELLKKISLQSHLISKIPCQPTIILYNIENYEVAHQTFLRMTKTGWSQYDSFAEWLYNSYEGEIFLIEIKEIEEEKNRIELLMF